MPRENKKEIILKASIDIFYLKGFNGATTPEIAERAGVAQGTIFRYFKTKNDILLSILENFIEQFSEVMIMNPFRDILEKEEKNNVRETLKMLIKNRLEFVEQNTEVVWIVITEMKYNAEIKNRIINKVLKPTSFMVKDFFQYGIKKGILRECDLDALFRLFLSLIFSVILEFKVFSDLAPPSQEQISEGIDKAIDLLLNGILKEREVL